MRESIDVDAIAGRQHRALLGSWSNDEARTLIREDVPQLLAEVRQLRAQLEQYAGDTRHVIELRALDFMIKHPMSCRPNLFDCPLGTVTNAIARVAGPPAKLGRYYCELTDDGKLAIGDPVEPNTAAVSDG